tara:strand:+ start:102 stop:761 length:660 start_codon:yes stop_codon:yes gene_type:complete
MKKRIKILDEYEPNHFYVAYMKKFLAILVLSLCLTIPSQANDIKDFQIEGISVGDSLLDFFNQDTIQSSRKYQYKDDKFYSLDIFSNKIKEFDALQFHLKKNDKSYKIYGFSGAVIFGESGKYYPESEKKCKIKKKEIENSIKSLFSNAKTKSESIDAVKGDPQAAIRHDTYFVLNNGDVWLQCYSFLKKSKEESNLFDNLRVTILSEEFKKWLNTKAF